MSSDEALTRFAKILALKDKAEGGFEWGAWGAASVAWAVGVKKDHGSCGKLDTSSFEDFKAGRRDSVVVVCPVHGELEGPSIPK